MEPSSPAPASPGGGFPSLDAASGGASAKPKGQPPITISISRTEERSGMGGLRSYTAYCVEVSDFGKNYVVERRFDDFQKLHADLLPLDPTLPALPEKKMFASTDASVVAERKPAFERLLRHMLKNEEIACESGHHLWKFIEFPAPGVPAVRYLFKNRRANYILACRKLLAPDRHAEHAYRVCHDTIIKANLALLATEGALATAIKAATPSKEAIGDLDATATAAEPAPDADGYGGDTPPATPPSEAELETGILEMLQYSVGKGSPDARRCFLAAGGLGTMLDLLRRKAIKKASSQDVAAAAAPDPKVRGVLNALLQGEGDNFSTTFAEFLQGGGVSTLSGLKDLCSKHVAFAEFLGKLLWISWEPSTQRAFLTADASSGTEALVLLSAIFSSGTKSGQAMAGLLLSCLIANGLFSNDPAKEAKAASGVDGLVEELLVSLPSFKGGPSKASGAKTPEDVQSAEAYLQSLGRNERFFARLLACVSAPCDMEGGGRFAPPDSVVWSACAFALWCLVKVQPKPCRITKLRPWIPHLAQAGPPRVRWLSGDLLLQLHVAGDSTDSAGASGGDADRPTAEAIALEQRAVEASMTEQIGHALGQLQETLQQKRGEMQQQLELCQMRQQAVDLAADGTFSSEVASALKNLVDVRTKLAEVTGSVRDKELGSRESLDSLTKAAESGPDDRDSQQKEALEKVHELEGYYQAKMEEFSQYDEALKQQTDFVDTCSKAMDEADQKVSRTRKLITELEEEMRTKQKDAQHHRRMAMTDFGAETNRVNDEMNQIDTKVTRLREKAAEVQNSENDADAIKDLMAPLKQEAAKLKQRKKDLQEELKTLQGGPDESRNSASRLEYEANAVQEQLTNLRTTELVGLEHGHLETREAWQHATTRMQEVRIRRDSLDREAQEFKRQMDDRWRMWKPLWSARLTRWRDRASALGQAQVVGKQFADSVDATWQLFSEEQEARRRVLQAVASSQERLASLAQEMSGIGDI